MNKEKKQHIIDEFVQIFGVPGIYLLDFKGLNVAEITELRSSLREARVSMRVVKNTLAKRALKKAGIGGLDSFFIGPTGVVWSSEDSITPARLLLDFIKKYNKGYLKAGLIDGLVIKDTDIERISKLPGKKELQAKVASALNAPIAKLAIGLNALPQKFIGLVDALREKKSGEAA